MYFSGRHLQRLALRPANTHARDQGIEVGTGEFPLEWMRDALEVALKYAASALFWLNVAMLCAYWVWGLANPWMIRRGLHADRLMALGLPFSFLFLAIIILAGTALSTWTGVFWTLYCVACTFVALTQPAIAMAFPPTLAGRGLSAFNLVIFAGIFVVQWGIGLAVDCLLYT